MIRSVNPPGYRNRLSYHATLLGTMALLAGTALVFGDLSTRDAILERAAEDRRTSLTEVIPVAMHDNDLLEDVLTVPDSHGAAIPVYLATKAGQIVAAAFQVTGQGYGGAIDIMMGVDSAGRILGVRIISHAETPGLGDKIELGKSNWILSFDSLSLSNTPDKEWRVKKDGGRFDQFTGATITPRAVVKAVHEGLAFYQRHRSDILAAQTSASENNTEESKP